MTSLAEQPPPDADAANGVATDAKSKDDVDMKEADETEQSEKKTEEAKEKENEQTTKETEEEKYDPKEGPKILANVPDLPRNAALHVTEQQKYALRQQIAAYAHICQQLLQLTHEAAQRDVQMRGEYDHISNYREKQKKEKQPRDPKERKTGSIFSNTGVYGYGKSRWTPTPAQFERLEQLFAIDTTTPMREHLKQVTEELSALGPIQECNVYNWFQNKKARLKKREQDAARERMEADMRAKSEQHNSQLGNLS